jgi:hypothetical protein
MYLSNGKPDLINLESVKHEMLVAELVLHCRLDELVVVVVEN